MPSLSLRSLALVFVLLAAPAAANAQAASPLCRGGNTIEVEWNGTWYAAGVLAGPNAAGECQIHYTGWDNSWDEWVSAARMRAVPGSIQACPAGATRQLSWGTKAYDVTIVAGPDEAGACQVRYDRWTAWTTWVAADLLQTANTLCNPGATLEVEWNGTWYPSRAVSGTDEACLIHYDGWSESWDEVVGPARMRPTP